MIIPQDAVKVTGVELEVLTPIFARITKVDEVTRTVTGRATQEMVDRDKEVFDYDSSKPNFQRWSAEVYSDTGGKSLGNVRAMHGSVAAGILKDIDFNDAEKAIDVRAQITDDQEWKKVLTGTYSGFSIGGKYTKKWSDTLNGQIIRRYTADPAEISIVDRPCVPAAKFFTVHKADGSDIEVPFAPSLMLPTEGSATDGAVAGLGFYARIKLEKNAASDLAKWNEDQERDDHGRFGSGDGAAAADSKADAHARMASLHERAAAASKTEEIRNQHLAASKAHDKASESYRTASAHFGTGNVEGGNVWMHDSGKLGAKASKQTDALRRADVPEFTKDGGGDMDVAIAKVGLGSKDASQANAMEATGAALGASNQAFTTNDVGEHETAAAAHAKAAQEQLALGNTNLASHHINAAKGHLDWPTSKSAKVPPQPAQGKRVVH